MIKKLLSAAMGEISPDPPSRYHLSADTGFVRAALLGVPSLWVGPQFRQLKLYNACFPGDQESPKTR